MGPVEKSVFNICLKPTKYAQQREDVVHAATACFVYICLIISVMN